MAKTEPGTDLEVIETPVQAMEAMRGNLVVKVQDPAEVQRQMMERIFDSDDVDAILGPQIATHAQDVLGRPFTLRGVRFLKSKYDKGLPVFAVMDATFLDDGQEAAVTCSAFNVAAAAAKLWQIDALPIDVKIIQSDSETANGFRPLSLTRA